jgi:hypothetical protein
MTRRATLSKHSRTFHSISAAGEPCPCPLGRPKHRCCCGRMRAASRQSGSCCVGYPSGAKPTIRQREPCAWVIEAYPHHTADTHGAQTSTCATESCDGNDYSGKDLTKEFYTKGSVKFANFSNSNLTRVSLFGANLTGAKLVGTSM